MQMWPFPLLHECTLIKLLCFTVEGTVKQTKITMFGLCCYWPKFFLTKVCKRSLECKKEVWIPYLST